MHATARLASVWRDLQRRLHPSVEVRLHLSYQALRRAAQSFDELSAERDARRLDSLLRQSATLDSRATDLGYEALYSLARAEAARVLGRARKSVEYLELAAAEYDRCIRVFPEIAYELPDLLPALSLTHVELTNLRGTPESRDLANEAALRSLSAAPSWEAFGHGAAVALATGVQSSTAHDGASIQHLLLTSAIQARLDTWERTDEASILLLSMGVLYLERYLDTGEVMCMALGVTLLDVVEKHLATGASLDPLPLSRLNLPESQLFGIAHLQAMAEAIGVEWADLSIQDLVHDVFTRIYDDARAQMDGAMRSGVVDVAVMYVLCLEAQAEWFDDGD